MARLPIPGQDGGTWGNLLNEFLEVEHNPDGTLKVRTDGTVVHTTGAQTIAGVKTFQDSPVAPNPTQNGQVATKSYVDAQVSAGAPDASPSTKGIVRLAGDLDGTADAPTVPGLATKADNTAVVHNTGNENIAGIKTFTSAPVVPSNAFPIAAVTNLSTSLSAKEDTANKGANNGYAPLDGTAKVPLANLPVPLAQSNTHASADTDTAPTAIHHTLGTGANQAAAGNHTHAGAGLTSTQVWAWDGTAQVITGIGRWYNRTGAAVVISGVWAAAGIAPTGANLIVDVNVNGTTIFTTQANRPTITAGTNGGALAVPDITTVNDGDYVTIDIDQVGTTAVGANITVGIVYA